MRHALVLALLGPLAVGQAPSNIHSFWWTPNGAEEGPMPIFLKAARMGDIAVQDNGNCAELWPLPNKEVATMQWPCHNGPMSNGGRAAAKPRPKRVKPRGKWEGIPPTPATSPDGREALR